MDELLMFFKEWGISILAALALLSGGFAIPGLRMGLMRVFNRILATFASEAVLAPLAISILKKLAASTENKLDDKAIELVEQQLGLKSSDQ